MGLLYKENLSFIIMQTHTGGERDQNEEYKLRLGASTGWQKLVTCSPRFLSLSGRHLC